MANSFYIRYERDAFAIWILRTKNQDFRFDIINVRVKIQDRFTIKKRLNINYHKISSLMK